MNRIVVQRCVLLGVLMVLLGGIVLLTSAPSQETEQNVTQEIVEPDLPNRPPEGYQVPARPAVTFPHTNVSADRLRLANIRRVSDEDLTFAQPPRFSDWAVSPDGQWKLLNRSDGIAIIRTNGSGETRIFSIEEPGSDREISTSPIWSWDGGRIFYKVKRPYYTDENRQEREYERWVESVDVATSEITRHEDIGPWGGAVRSFATARYPDDPVVYLNYDDDVVSVGTYDGSTRWVIDHNVNFLSLSPNKQMILTEGEGRFDYFVYSTAESGLLHNFRFSDLPDSVFLWSPDSTKFVYQVSRSDGHSGELFASELYLMNIDGTGRTQITNTPDIPEEIVGWTQNSQLVFRVSKDGLYIADLVAK